MKRRAIAVSAALALAGCAGNDGKLEIRRSPASSAHTEQPVPERIAEAHAQLALGNVALALELFRKAERDAPGTVQALVGMAACYDRMGRYDLSSMKLEAALAREPQNANLLKRLAASFAQQGRHEEASAAQSQAEALAAAARARSQAEVLAAAARARSQAEALAATAVPRSVTLQLPPARVAEVSEINSAPPKALPPTALPPPARSVTVALPAAKPALPHPEARAPVAPAAPRRVRLERVSPNEIALVTSGRAPWSRVIASAPRFTPLNRGAASVRLLNAARYQGLAARTRISLQRRGWGKVAIGDAPRTRQRSLILYSTQNRPVAIRLANEFGFALARDPRPGRVTVLLGRDAVHLMRPERA